MDFKEKRKRADALIKEINKKGDGRLNWGSEIPDITFISTGLEAVDMLTGSYGEGMEPDYLGHGGIPYGRFTVIWGAEGVGKSTLVDRIIGNAQAQEKLCMLIDGENRRKKEWMETQGVNLKDLIWHRGGMMERGLQDIIDLLPLVDLIVVDTVHSLVPKGEIQAADGAARDMMDNAPRSRQAAALTEFFRMATAKVAKADVAIILVGQARDKSVMQKTIKDLVGGNALRHYATLRMQIVKIMSTDKLKGAGCPKKKIPDPGGFGGMIEVPTGFLQKIILEKAGTNHREGQSIHVPFLYGLGPDDFKSNVMSAVACGIIKTTSAGWYEVPTAEEPQKIHGKAALLAFFTQNTGHYDWLMQSIMKTEEEADESVQDTEEEAPRKKSAAKK
jgi:RecA/RadA recombinase